MTVREASKRPQDGLQRVRLVRDSLAETQNGSEDRLAPWLQKLDTANYRLKETMDDLRSTMVHAALSPPEEANNWTQKSLLSFIDEAGVEGVRRNVYAAIDEAKATKPKLMESTTEFLNAAKAAEDRDQASLREYAVLQAVPPQFSSILESLDQGAADVAEDLDSLVKHYDLCMTAFRYTENFVEAAKTISMDPPPDYPVGHKLDHSLKKPLEPISEEERREMLQIVAKDAAEVDDVVVSIQDRVIEMEEQMERIEVYSRGMKDLIRDGEESRKDFGRAVTLIIGTEAALENFHAAWQDLDGMFADYLGELDSLSEVYTGFLTAYDGLIVEVARRGHAKQQRLKVVASATRALEQLYIQELGERDAFRERHGDSLPTDLWPGLMDRPLKFVVSQAKDDGLPIPELPSDVVEAAAKRLGRAT